MPADDAFLVDTSNMSVEEACQAAMAHVMKCAAAVGWGRVEG
jgi:cytidylate kinase